MGHARRIVAGLVTAMLVAPLPAQAAPPGFTAEDHDDALCALVASYTLGAQSQAMTAEDRRGVVGMMLYFVGKIRGRHPALTMTELLAPEYVRSVESRIGPAAERCSAEVARMGADLQAAGRILVEADGRALVSPTL